MKVLHIVLAVIIVLLLAALYLKLTEVGTLIAAAEYRNQPLIDSQRALIAANQRLETSLGDLRKQIDDLSNRVLKK